MKNKVYKIISYFVIICAFFRGCGRTAPENIYNNTLTTIDVGQASATLIESDGSFRLIDRGKEKGGKDIVSYLDSRNVKKIDLLVLSHFHYDHTGQALDVIRNFDIGTVVIPHLTEQNIPDTYFYESLIQDGNNGYFKLEYAAKDKEFAVGNGVVKILADTINHKGENNTSIVLSYTRQNFTWLYTGDMESDCDDIIMDNLPENIGLYTASHHGSSDSNSLQLLERINPQYIVISCGKDNDYGHPHKKFIDRAESMGIPYGITFEKGNIVYNTETGEISGD